VGNFRRSSLLAQTTLARSEIRSSVWLPLVEQLLQHQVDGVQPEHAALLVLCDRILAGQKPTDRERDNAVRAADAVGFDETQCRHLIDAAQLLQSGDDAWGLVKAIADYRKSVLGDAFEKIASAFAAEAGWSLEGLLAESAPVRAHGLN